MDTGRTSKVSIFNSVTVCKYLSPIDASVEGVNSISLFYCILVWPHYAPVGCAHPLFSLRNTKDRALCPPLSHSQIRLIFYRNKIYVRDSNSGAAHVLSYKTRDVCVKGVRLMKVSQKVPGKSQLGASKIRQTNQSVRHEWESRLCP